MIKFEGWEIDMMISSLQMTIPSNLESEGAKDIMNTIKKIKQLEKEQEKK